MPEIEYPWVLILLIPFIFLAYFAYKRKDPTLKIPSLKPYSSAGAVQGFSVYSIPFVLYLFATALLILALARPRKGIERTTHKAEGIDIIIAVDLSGSMRAIDDIPQNIKTQGQVYQAVKDKKIKNRLDTAKFEIKKFIEKRPNDKIGLIAFADKPFPVCPPTLDHAWLIRQLERLKVGMIGDATGIAGPIASAVKRLKSDDSKRKVMVLFSDGENTVKARITPLQGAELAKMYNVVIYTVGIGSANSYIMQNTFMGPKLILVQNQFDTELLEEIANITDGKYYKAADAEGLRKAMNEINKIEKTSIEQKVYINYREWAPNLIITALILIGISFLLQNTLLLKTP